MTARIRLDAQIAVYEIFKENDQGFKYLGIRAEVVTETSCGRMFQSRICEDSDEAIEDLFERYAAAGYAGLFNTIIDAQCEAQQLYDGLWQRYKKNKMQRRKTQKRSTRHGKKPSKSQNRRKSRKAN